MPPPTLPVEVLERILDYAFRPTPSSPLQSTPSSLPTPLPHALPLLLISRSFRLLALPFFYRSITIVKSQDWSTLFDSDRGLFTDAEEGKKRWGWVKELCWDPRAFPPLADPRDWEKRVDAQGNEDKKAVGEVVKDEEGEGPNAEEGEERDSEDSDSEDSEDEDELYPQLLARLSLPSCPQLDHLCILQTPEKWLPMTDRPDTLPKPFTSSLFDRFYVPSRGYERAVRFCSNSALDDRNGTSIPSLPSKARSRVWEMFEDDISDRIDQEQQDFVPSFLSSLQPKTISLSILILNDPILPSFHRHQALLVFATPSPFRYGHGIDEDEFEDLHLIAPGIVVRLVGFRDVVTDDFLRVCEEKHGKGRYALDRTTRIRGAGTWVVEREDGGEREAVFDSPDGEPDEVRAVTGQRVEELLNGEEGAGWGSSSDED
jgi:hypothetical protein